MEVQENKEAMQEKQERKNKMFPLFNYYLKKILYIYIYREAQNENYY